MKRLPVNERRIIADEIEQHLSYEPLNANRRRKHLEPNNMGFNWELRIGNYRVLYDVDDSNVFILAVATKRRSDYYIKGKKVEL